MDYPIGIQSFETIRTEDFVYVDKTAFVYQMVRRTGYYFLSRPRRFGKSLLVSTLEAYFLGKKELFKGLAIEKQETEWKTYPVLRLDLNARNYKDAQSLDAELNKHLVKWEAIYGMVSDLTLAPEERFGNVVQRAYEQTHEKVVILVDEYDKPLLETIDNSEVQDAYRKTLQAFYGVLKSQDDYIRFGFLTGVTKFSKVTIFSGLNNLRDISMSPQYVDVCGISEKELQVYFDESIHELAAANNTTYEKTCEKLREQYDGYHFYPNTIGIYNPFSLLNTFQDQVFKDYWFETGTPTFLVRLLASNNCQLSELQGTEISASNLSVVDTMLTSPIPVMYQSGYLTIKGYDEEFDLYILDYPNMEVKRGFINYLIPYYTSLTSSNSDSVLKSLVRNVMQGNPEEFMQRLQTMLAASDYRIAGDKEIYFQNALHLIFTMLSFNVKVEEPTSNGRMDFIIYTKDYIYIFEFKLDHTAEEALQQIKDKQYARPFQMDPRKLYLIGVNFSSETRTIEKWIME